MTQGPAFDVRLFTEEMDALQILATPHRETIQRIVDEHGSLSNAAPSELFDVMVALGVLVKVQSDLIELTSCWLKSSTGGRNRPLRRLLRTELRAAKRQLRVFTSLRQTLIDLVAEPIVL